MGTTRPLRLQVWAFAPQRQSPKIKGVLEKVCFKKSCHQSSFAFKWGARAAALPRAGLPARQSAFQAAEDLSGFAPAEIYFKVTNKERIRIFCVEHN